MQWLRRNFITGFFVTVPLIISIAAFVWIFQVIDGFMSPLYARWLSSWLGRPITVPGLGILTTAIFVLVVGVLASNVIGKRLLQRTESYLLRVPVFRTIYSPVKQIVLAFSPDNEYGFKRVVLVQPPGRGRMIGFLTKEFTLDVGHGATSLVAVYVPTNHLYMGDIVIVPREEATFPDLTVEEGIRIVLTGGMALPERIRGRQGGDGVGEYRV